jgi:hypothetical protein
MRQTRHAPFRRNLHSPLTWWQEMRLPRPERQAARAEREAEYLMRRERDNEQSAAARAAALEAESRRDSMGYGSGGIGGIG